MNEQTGCREDHNQLSEAHIWVCPEKMQECSGCGGSVAGNSGESVSGVSHKRRYPRCGEVYLDGCA